MEPEDITSGHEGFDRLFHRFQRPLLAFFSRRTSDSGVAENLSQETFLRAFRYRHTYDPARRLSAWIFRIASNIHKDWLKGQGRPSIPLAPDPALQTLAALPEDTALARNELQAVLEAMADMPEKYRAVLLLKHYQRLKYSEIAAQLGLNEGTVKSRLNTAAGLLREKLRREGWMT